GVVAGGVVAIAATVWFLHPPRAPRPTEVDEKEYKYLHCSKCDREWALTRARASEPCPFCAVELVPTIDSVKKSGKPPNRFNKMFMVVYAELVVVMAVVLFLTRRRAQEEDTDYLYMRCGQCEQKLRYREEQAGRFGKCPRCRKLLIFPSAADSVPVE